MGKKELPHGNLMTTKMDYQSLFKIFILMIFVVLINSLTAGLSFMITIRQEMHFLIVLIKSQPQNFRPGIIKVL